jgi:hypothetical protein
MAPWLWLPVAAIVVLSSALGYLLLRPDDCSFDQRRWNMARAVKDSSERFDLIEHELRTLVGCRKLDGKSRDEVETLIGRRNGSSERHRYWYYNVGIPDSLSDYPGLELTFSRSGRVIDARVGSYIEPK